MTLCGFRKGNGNYLSLTGSVVVFWSSDSEYLLLCREICSLGFIFRATRTISRHSQWKAADQCFRVQGSQKKKIENFSKLTFLGQLRGRVSNKQPMSSSISCETNDDDPDICKRRFV